MSDKELKIDVISDTHTQHGKIELPGGDILIHAGDISYRGTIQEIYPFLEWFAAQPYKHLVLVPGNHDWGFEKAFGVFADECKRKNITLLSDSGIEVEGVKIWGSPIQPEFCNWAFNRQRGEEIRRHWDLIPEDTEILVTHGPPMGILDKTFHNEEVGCLDLYHRIIQTKMKLHVFGHIHEAFGHRYIDGRTYINASSVDGRYIFRKPGYTHVVKSEGYYFVGPSEIDKP